MNQVKLAVQDRPATGKGASGRLRHSGRVPGVMYGFGVSPIALSVDKLELFHALHGPAGRNVLLTIEADGADHLCVARDIQRHPVRGDYVHLDLLAVDKNATIVVDVRVILVGEAVQGSIVQQVLTTVSINVPPLSTPNSFELSIEEMQINEVKRVEDLTHLLPEGASWEIDEKRTVVTVNPPTVEEADDDEDSDLLEVKTDDDESEA
jgi:large subunit ribosomal protein L25